MAGCPWCGNRKQPCNCRKGSIISWSALSIGLASLTLLASCPFPLPAPCGAPGLPPCATATPSVTPPHPEPTTPPTPGPLSPTPTPTDTPAPGGGAAEHVTAGHAVIRLHGVMEAIRRRPPDTRLIFGVFLWETEAEPLSQEVPRLTLVLRGSGQELCQRRPCGPEDVGLSVRWSANDAADAAAFDEAPARRCRAGRR